MPSLFIVRNNERPWTPHNSLYNGCTVETLGQPRSRLYTWHVLTCRLEFKAMWTPFLCTCQTQICIHKLAAVYSILSFETEESCLRQTVANPQAAEDKRENELSWSSLILSWLIRSILHRLGKMSSKDRTEIWCLIHKALHTSNAEACKDSILHQHNLFLSTSITCSILKSGADHDVSLVWFKIPWWQWGHMTTYICQINTASI